VPVMLARERGGRQRRLGRRDQTLRRRDRARSSVHARISAGRLCSE
jgi:hypothetical protein